MGEQKLITRASVFLQDHHRVTLFAKRQGMKLSEAYGLIVKAFLDRDGKIREHTKVYVPLSVETYKILSQKAEEYHTTERVLVTALIDLSDRYSELFKGRFF